MFYTIWLFAPRPRGLVVTPGASPDREFPCHFWSRSSRRLLASARGARWQEIAGGCPAIPGGVRVGASRAARLVARRARVATAVTVAVRASAGCPAHRRRWGRGRHRRRRGGWATSADVQQCVRVPGPQASERVEHRVVEHLGQHGSGLLRRIGLQHEGCSTRHMRASHRSAAQGLAAGVRGVRGTDDIAARSPDVRAAAIVTEG